MLSKLILLAGLVCLSTGALEPILNAVQVHSSSISSTDCVLNTKKVNPHNRQMYFQCTRRGLALMKCPETMVFETVSNACSRDNIPPPNEPRPDCLVDIELVYIPAFTTCAGFWQCSHANAVYFSCSSDLVFNPAQHVCDWTWNVAPPCGTFTGVPTGGWKGAKTNFIPQNNETDKETKNQRKWEVKV